MTRSRNRASSWSSVHESPAPPAAAPAPGG
ncbi:hypothetical protein STIAU_7785, partial [Stigmatella aurantiaca DW4/3-1]